MKSILKKTLFTLIFIIGTFVGAFAQNNDNRNNPPPKKDPPKVEVPPKNGSRPPDNSNKPKKPSGEYSDDIQKLTSIYD